MTTNDILLDGILSTLSSSQFFGEGLTFFWIFAIISFLLVYFALTILTDLRKNIKILASLIIPIILDILIPFGDFTFSFPFISYTYTIHHGVLFLNLIDQIMTYQIFLYLSSPMLEPFVEAALTTSEFFIVSIVAFLSTSLDTILEFVFLFGIIYGAITIIEEVFEKDYRYQVPIAGIIAIIPVFLFSFFIANPIHETQELIKTYNGFMAFIGSGSLIDIGIVLVSFVFNFILIIGIMSVFAAIFISAAFKIFYSKKELDYKYDWTGYVIMMTVIYTTIFLLHSDYHWYLVFPIFVIYAQFKNKTASIINRSQERINERKKMDTLTNKISSRIAAQNNTSVDIIDIPKEFSIDNIIILILIITFAILMFFYLM